MAQGFICSIYLISILNQTRNCSTSLISILKQRQKWFVIERFEHIRPKYKIEFSLYLYYVTPVSTPHVDLKMFSDLLNQPSVSSNWCLCEWYIFMHWQLPLSLFEIIIVGMIIVSVVGIQRCPIYSFVILYIKVEPNYLLTLYLFAWIFHIILYRQLSNSTE